MNKVCVIAEAGVNHDGDLLKAKKLIDIASKAQADYVKFQTFISEKLVTKKADKADYQKTQTGETSQLEMLKKLELSKEDHFELIDYCHSKNIKFLSTAFDLESIDFLKSLKLDLWKIPSGEITNYPYLKKIAQFNDKVVISTGMANLAEVKSALDALVKNGTNRENITVLHCNTQYPTPYEDVNLRAMQTMGKELNMPVGYSDHTLGIAISISAVALGAQVIEKHFTLNRDDQGPDHNASLSPEELEDLVKGIRAIEAGLGSEVKEASKSEVGNKESIRKSIVAARKIVKGETFSDENLTTKRPGTGICPMQWDEIVGTRATKDYQEDDLI